MHLQGDRDSVLCSTHHSSSFDLIHTRVSGQFVRATNRIQKVPSTMRRDKWGPPQSAPKIEVGGGSLSCYQNAFHRLTYNNQISYIKVVLWSGQNPGWRDLLITATDLEVWPCPRLPSHALQKTRLRLSPLGTIQAKDRQYLMWWHGGAVQHELRAWRQCATCFNKS